MTVHVLNNNCENKVFTQGIIILIACLSPFSRLFFILFPHAMQIINLFPRSHLGAKIFFIVGPTVRLQPTLMEKIVWQADVQKCCLYALC